MKFGKIFKRTLSMLTATAIFCSLSIPAFAQSPNSDENGEYVVTYRAEPVTDIDALVALAAQQPKAASSEEEDDGLLRVEQLVEVREYTDGAIEKDYAESAISLAADQDLSSSKTNNRVKDYMVSVTFNYTYRYSNGDKYRANSVVTMIAKTNATSNRIVQAQELYRAGGFEGVKDIYYNNGGVGTQTFTLQSKHTGFYPSYGDPTTIADGVSAQSWIDFSNGEEITIQIIPSPPSK